LYRYANEQFTKYYQRTADDNPFVNSEYSKADKFKWFYGEPIKKLPEKEF
jgi:hypothetical protein